MSIKLIVIGNILSFFSVLCLFISIRQSNRKDMLKFQFFDTILAVLSCFVLKGYSGMATDFVASIRNLLNLKHEAKKDKKSTQTFKTIEEIFILLLFIILGFIFNKEGFIGFLPIIAAIEYTIFMFHSKSLFWLKFSLMINLILWGIYYFVILNIVGFIVKFILVFCSFCNLIKIINNKNI